MITVVYIGSRFKTRLGKWIKSFGPDWHWLHMRHPEEFSCSSASARFIFCIDAPTAAAERFRENLLKQLPMDSLTGFIHLCEPGDRTFPSTRPVDYLGPYPPAWQIGQSLLRLSVSLSTLTELRSLQNELSLRTKELAELNKIGIALSSERELDTLLELILTKAREITHADAGSLYLVEKNDTAADENNPWANKQLRFKLAQNDSIESSYQEFFMPIERKSMAGYTVLSEKPLNITDAYHLPPNSAFQHNQSFDQKMGYHTKSVLCLPLKNHQGEMIGVLQLINRKRDPASRLASLAKVRTQVVPFDRRCEELASSLASQAAVSIENMRLYEEIKRLFEGFIVASVHAIEQRDPTTYGHSGRVAALTVGLAQQVDRMSDGPFRSVTYSRDDIQQIQYAALLHDFGKIGVREKVLVKAKKLYPEHLEAIHFRSRFIKKMMEMNVLEKKLQLLTKGNPAEKEWLALEQAVRKQSQDIDQMMSFILQANEPKILAENDFELLQAARNKIYWIDREPFHLLTDDELLLLSIGRGSLSAGERQEIESHVTHTFNFLSRIPWAAHLSEIPEIAFAHHEKLDGTGYPRGLRAPQIPLPARMIAIADIFDALTAWDRPYKRAVSTEHALDILAAEVAAGKLDAQLFSLFREAEIYRLVSNDSEDK